MTVEIINSDFPVQFCLKYSSVMKVKLYPRCNSGLSLWSEFKGEEPGVLLLGGVKPAKPASVTGNPKPGASTG